MLHVVTLVVLLTAVGWSVTEFQPARQPDPVAAAPDWRRTSAGWIKVGASGAAALDVAAPNPAQEPALHPGLVAMFVLLAGVLSLMTFDRPVRAADAIAALAISLRSTAFGPEAQARRELTTKPPDEAPAHG